MAESSSDDGFDPDDFLGDDVEIGVKEEEKNDFDDEEIIVTKP